MQLPWNPRTDYNNSGNDYKNKTEITTAMVKAPATKTATEYQYVNVNLNEKISISLNVRVNWNINEIKSVTVM